MIAILSRFVLLAVASCVLLAMSVAGSVAQENHSAAGSPVKPGEPSPSDLKASQQWWQLTSLAEGEILKRIAPPFPPCRTVYHRVTNAGWASPPPLPDVHCIRWQPGNMRRGEEKVGPATIPFIVSSLLHIAVERQEIEGPPELLNAPIEGDWIVRDGAPPETVLPRMEELLRKECGLAVKLRLDKVEREVIVATGKYRLAPAKEPKSIRVYGSVLTDGAGGGGSGDFAEFIRSMGSRVSRRIVNEVAQPPEGRVEWRYNAPFPRVEGWDDRDAARVLAHLSEQTGLVFAKAKRNVPVLFVERAE
ncbi:MAG: hypothetical protein NTW96_07690 [Planctomycetia bacterium]|nr:hypothetical protein [Planctomycetia bacterium]